MTVTAKELAEWVAELPEEARPPVELNDDDEPGTIWRRTGPLWGTIRRDEVLALWFTAATLWMAENSTCAPRFQCERDDLWHVYDTPDAFGAVANCYYSGTGTSPYHALAEAVRRVRGGGE